MSGDRILLTAEEAADLLGVSERTFIDLRKEEWMPLPLQLGPRMLRWVRVELEQALVSSAPRAARVQPQPPELAKKQRKWTDV